MEVLYPTLGLISHSLSCISRTRKVHEREGGRVVDGHSPARLMNRDVAESYASCVVFLFLSFAFYWWMFKRIGYLYIESSSRFLGKAEPYPIPCTDKGLIIREPEVVLAASFSFVL